MTVKTECPEINPGTFLYILRQVTETAALAAFSWIGRGDQNSGDGAAVEAMRAKINELGLSGVVVIGEGEKDEAPALYNGEEFGNPSGPSAFDIAVDPVEGTGYLAKGITNSMAVMAVSPRGTMFDPGPAFYMEKFAAGPEVKGKIDPAAPTSEKLAIVAKETGKKVEDLVVYVLEKPRHKEMVQEIYKAGARVALYPAGDVAGAIQAVTPGTDIDILMGTGGTPEGVISACVARALGGEFMGRIDPQLQTEREAVAAAGLDTKRWYASDELVRSEDVFFCATGITTGMLFEGVEPNGGLMQTETLMISGNPRQRGLLRAFH